MANLVKLKTTISDYNFFFISSGAYETVKTKDQQTLNTDGMSTTGEILYTDISTTLSASNNDINTGLQYSKYAVLAAVPITHSAVYFTVWPYAYTTGSSSASTSKFTWRIWICYGAGDKLSGDATFPVTLRIFYCKL